MDCASCNKPNPAGHKFCGHCGHPLSTICPTCTFANEPGHKFCGACGGALDAKPVPQQKTEATEAERRQLTIMFCDLVGSTAMSEAMDPEDLRDVLSTYQETCKKHLDRYDGYIARYMGDGLLIYFGYPSAHERDPERAVRAGLDIVADVSSQCLPDGTALQVRIGIATGLVVVGDLIGEGASEERAVLGDTPNLAARLQGLAAPNTVVVSAATKRLVESVFVFDDLGPQSLKGISHRVHAFAARRETALSGNGAAPQKTFKLIGRQSEFEQMKTLWQTASRGFGQTLMLSGEAGFGKSHLIAAFVASLDRDACVLVNIKASEFHQDSSFRPLRHRFEAALMAFDSNYSEAPAAVLERWLNSIAPLNRETTQLTYGFLGLPVDDSLLADLDGATLKNRTLETLVQLIEAMAAGRPQLIVVEDAQWLDPSTGEFLSRLVNHVATLSCLLIVVARPDFSADWRAGSHIQKINLGRMSQDEAETVIDQIDSDRVLPVKVREALLEHGDGIPLFVEELTRSVLESQQDGSGQSEITVPTRLQDSLMARLDRLGPTKLVAQKAAVIGRVFQGKILHAITADDGFDTERGLLDLLSADLLIPRTDLGDGLFEFRHALIRDIAYQSLLIRRRKEIHRDVAEASLVLYPEIKTAEPEVVAFHYSAAGMTEQAYPLWRTAGDRATARWANTEAIAHYRKALDALAKGDFAPPLAEIELLLDMVSCMRIVDRFNAGFEALEQAERLARMGNFDRQLIRIYYLRGNLCFPTGDFENCVKSHGQARDLARKLHLPADEARAESGLGDASLYSGHVKTAEANYNAAIEIARAHNLPAIVTTNLPLRGHMRLYLNQFEEALSDCLEAAELATKAKNRRAEMVARGSCLTKVYYELGDWEGAIEQSERALEIAKTIDAHRFIPMYLCFLAKVALAKDQTDVALALAKSSVEHNRQHGFVFSGAMTLGTLARAVSDPQEADGYLAEGQTILDQGCVSHNHFWYRLDGMELGLKRADCAMVESHASGLEGFIAKQTSPWAEFHIRRCRALAQALQADPQATTNPDLLALLAEARERHQKPAIASLQSAIRAQEAHPSA